MEHHAVWSSGVDDEKEGQRKDVKRLEDFQMWISSRMEMICWIEGETNEKVAKALE